VTDLDRLTYPQAVAALTERGRFGISMGLARVERLMDEAGHPERGLCGALVGGTNGKGSVVAMVQAVLTAAGLRTGTMPKPHLVGYR
jgi:dihydrofolate synthase/folylpolyglutamate synthase